MKDEICEHCNRRHGDYYYYDPILGVCRIVPMK